jgi:tetratricopeptide (TPR) repeat protein
MRTSARIGVLLLATITLGVGAVARGDGDAAASQPAGFTEAICTVWAQKVEKTINAGSGRYLDDSFDFDRLWAESTKGIDMPASYFRGLYLGMYQGKLGSRMVAQFKLFKGQYKFCAIRPLADGSMIAVFRKYSQGVNYHTFFLSVDKDNKVAITDLRFLYGGDNYSDAIRSLAQTMAGVFAAAKPDDAKKIMADLDTFYKQLGAGRYKEALVAYAKLPDDVKRDRDIQLFRIQALQATDEKAYLKAMTDFQKFFPGDYSKDWMSFHLYLDQKKYDEALAVVDALEAQVGKDAYLPCLRAEVYMEQQQYDKAKEFLAQAIQQESDFGAAYRLQFDIALKEKNFAAAAAALPLMDKYANGLPEDVKRSPACAAFLKSPEYKTYLENKDSILSLTPASAPTTTTAPAEPPADPPTPPEE